MDHINNPTKITILPYGFVSEIDTHLSEKSLRFFSFLYGQEKIDEKLLSLARYTVYIKAPIFIKLIMADSGLRIFPVDMETPIADLEYYLPSIQQQDTSYRVPICAYTYFIVSGTVMDWILFMNEIRGHSVYNKDICINDYVYCIYNLMKANWFSLDMFIKGTT